MLRRCLFHTLPNFSSYWLMVLTAAMRSTAASMGRATAGMGRATTRCCGMRGTMRRASTRCYGMRGAARPATAATACCR